MTRSDDLFAAIEADPTPIVEAAVERLVRERGRPTVSNALELRFGSNGSLWIDRTTGNWHDWENDIGGGSWKLADYAGLSTEEIARLYGLEHGSVFTSAERRALQKAADRRQQQRVAELTIRRQERRAEAERLLEGARPASPGDPASRYLLGRGLKNLTRVWYHPDPTIMTSRDHERRLAPSVLFEITDTHGDLCAVHCVQLDVRTGQRLTGRLAKISIGNLMDGYARFGTDGAIVCLGEGAETVASVHEVVPHWRCLAACSSIRIVDEDPDLADAGTIVLLAERGVEDNVRTLGHRAAAAFTDADIYLALVPAQVDGDKADMNDVLRVSSALVRHALSEDQLERLLPDH